MLASPLPPPKQTFFFNFQNLIKSLGKDNPPAASLHGRPKEAKGDNFPAPGDYNPDKGDKVVHDTSPKYTFGLKTNKEKYGDSPG